MAENWYWLPRSWMILHDTTKTYPKRVVCGVHRFLQFGCTQVCSSSHHVSCVGNICRQPAVNSHCTTRFAVCNWYHIHFFVADSAESTRHSCCTVKFTICVGQIPLLSTNQAFFSWSSSYLLLDNFT